MTYAYTYIYTHTRRVEDLKAASRKQLPDSVSAQDIGECLLAMRGESESGGANMLGVLHSMGYTRGLLNSLGFSEDARLQSLVWHARVGLLDEGERKRVLANRSVDLGVTHRALFAFSWICVFVISMLIPILASMGPFLFLVEWLGACTYFWWNCFGLNPLARESHKQIKDKAR
jgi:hypothetical protein